MRALGVTNAQLETALAQFGTNAGGGFTDQNAREYLIRNIGRTLSLDDLRNLVVATVNDAPVSLRQVAEVSFAAKVKRGDAGYMAKPAVIVSVEKQPDVDTVRLTRRIETALKEMAPTLPAGIRPTGSCSGRPTSSRPRSATSRASRRGGAGGGGGGAFAFLLNVRTTAISLLAIPVSVLTTAAVFHLFGLSINTMTLGGSPSPSANSSTTRWSTSRTFSPARREPEGRQPEERVPGGGGASNEVRSGIVYATLIIILVFVPLFALSAIEGRLFAPWGRPTSSPSWRACSPPSP